MTNTGAYNLADRALRMDMSMSMDSDEADFQSIEDVNIEIYILADWVYMKMDIPGMGEQWVKMAMDEEIEQSYNLNMVDEQLALLDSVVEMQLVREEPLDGTDCYLLSIVPDAAALFNWVQKQDASLEMDPDQVQKVADSFKEVSYLVWIARDTSLLRQMTMSLTMEVDQDLLSGQRIGSDTMTMSIDMTMKVHNYNEPVSVTLPDEAENAIEIPAGDFNGG
jgi:hypothetical protein